MSLSDVKHQGFAQRMIQRALAGSRVPHAYVFHGPSGVGKETLASGLAQLLLCSKPQERDLPPDHADGVGLTRIREGCGRCEDCRLVAAGTHPDFHIIYRQLVREHPDPEIRKRKALGIGVEVIRHSVIDRVILTPNRGRAKVFVIRDADGMTPQAQNALLKTLEEPPATTFLILLASALDHLLPTTQSRCQIVRFDALPKAFVRARLQELRPALPAEHQDWYAASSQGSLGEALESASNEAFDWNGRIAERLSAKTCEAASLVEVWNDAAEALGARYRKLDPDMSDTDAKRRGLGVALRITADWYAQQLRAVVAGGSQGDAEPRSAAIERIALAEENLDLNVNTELCLETLANDLVAPDAVVRA